MPGALVALALREPEPWRARILSAAAELDLLPGSSPELWRSLSQLERDDVRTLIELHGQRFPAERAELAQAMVRLFNMQTAHYPKALLEFVIWASRSREWNVETEARCLGVASGVLYDPHFYAQGFGVMRLRVLLGHMRKSGLERSLYRYLENALKRASR